ncbi:hypothetical protein HK096_003058, partial [Nowakowskiella sp. JEL0078]
MENRGEIDVKFTVNYPKSQFAPKFNFKPEIGSLGIGESQKIIISFNSDILGEFLEEFNWNLEGAQEPLLMICKGKVVGPTFNLSTSQINFGLQSYQFTSLQTVSISNTSSIPMWIKLRIPQDSEIEEFSVIPECGYIPPNHCQWLSISFNPTKIKKYETYLAVDIDGVGDDIVNLPITAQSIIPEIQLSTPHLDYGDCFLAFAYNNTIELRNETDFPAKYELQSQEETAKAVYAYKSTNGSGIIDPHSRIEINLEIQMKRLGRVNFPVFIKIFGQEEILAVEIYSRGIGPNVIISTSELNWGKINVLKESTLTFTIKNDSPIIANFSCVTVSELSVFRVSPISGAIGHGMTATFHVSAFLDDCLKFTDILKIGVQSGGVREIQLVAKGQGTTIVFDESLRNIDFENVFSNKECSREYLLTNKGRRSQTVFWTTEEKKVSKDSPINPSHFEVIPSRFLLRPGATQELMIKGYSTKAALCKEVLICFGTIDKDPTRRTIVETTLTANFINPFIDCIPSTLRFVSEFTNDDDFGLMSKELVLRNAASLPLHLSFKCPTPYCIEPDTTLYLKPNEAFTTIVTFDPSSNVDRVSCKEQKKLVISYQEHHQRDVIELYSEVSFPNLYFNNTKIDFGCILQETEQRKSFTMTNNSNLPVEYFWSFLDDLSFQHSSNIPINQVFDIQPISGILLPGDSENVQITFYGHPGGYFKATIICDVAGGPKYEVYLIGEASIMDFSFDKQQLDFGTQLYQDITEQELTLTNTGLVTFDFTIVIFDGPLTQKIVVMPSSGTIQPQGKQRITVKFCPCVPEIVKDKFYIQISHFEPISIIVTGTGIFPRISMNIPKIYDEKYDDHIIEAKNLILGAKAKNFENVKISTQQISELPVKITGDISLDFEIEAECERLLLRNRTNQFLTNFTFSEDVRNKTFMFPRQKFVGSSLIAQKCSTQSKIIKERKVIGSIEECSSIKLTKYLCDFGNVIKHTSKRKTIRISNFGLTPVSFFLDKLLLSGTGFNVEPERVKMLPPKESVEFQVFFQARSNTTELGCVQMEIPINVNGGPLLVLCLKADITVPEFQLSKNDVYFGEVLCGQRKSIFIQMQNSNNVPCEWTSIHTIDNNKAKHTQKKIGSLPISKEFELIPAFGSLQPGEKMQLMIRFSPCDEKDYDLVLPLKINLNSKAVSLHLFGRGAKYSIIFEPESISLGPILPCSDGIETKFSVFNPTKYPIEIFSVDFDKQYLEEEDNLKSFDGFENGIVFVPPREPGRGLPDVIMESIAHNRSEKLSKDNEIPSKNYSVMEGGVGELIETTKNTQKPGNQSNINLQTVSLTGQITSIVDVNNINLEPAIIVILHGPPLAGKTTQAMKLKKSFGFSIININEILESYTKPEISLTTTEQPNFRQPSKDPTKMLNSVNPNEIDESTSGKISEDAKLLIGENYDSFDLKISMPDEVVQEVIRNFLVKEDFSRGVVIDGLETKFNPNPVASLRGVLKGLPEKRKCYFIHMTLESCQIHDRESKIQKNSADKDSEMINCVKEITEQEYDLMSEIEKDIYDMSRIRYKKKMKEIHDRRKIEKRHWEEELASRLGEKKSEEDVKGKKKTKSRQNGGKIDKFDKTAPSPGQGTKPGELKKERGSITPKYQKRNEKGEKSDGREKGVENDDYSSRYTLDDFGDSLFLGEQVFRTLEQYQLTLEILLSVVKDGDKPNLARIINSTTTPEKKMLKGNKSLVATTSTIEAPATSIGTSDTDQHTAEDLNPIVLHEINASILEDNIFKTLVEIIPIPIEIEDTKEKQESVTSPYIEQLIWYPPDRPKSQFSFKNFVLMPPVSQESEEELPQIVVDQQPVGQPTKQELNKKSRSQPPKHVILEDIKVMEEPEETEKEPPTKYRWIILPHEKKELIVKFFSNEIGNFEQIFNFEIVGSRAKFNLHCVGNCQYAQIVTDYKKIFQKSRKIKEDRSILHGEYVLHSNMYEFGPLLYSKPREKYLEKFPENRAIFNIINPSQVDVKVIFALRSDKTDVFFFDPPLMELAPMQSQTFSLWAYPRQHNYFEDTLIICVKDNPEPLCYKISCIGVKPELEIDKKILSFDKLLLNRTERRELKLKNPTWMSIAWKIVGVDLLGDEFQVSHIEGVIEPFQETIVVAEFKGCKPIVFKKVIRVEVSDAEKIGGVFQEYTIVVTAEAYDIAMDLHFPKGYDGGLDFGTLKVFEEGKQMCTLKNKGKYEVGFKYVFDNKEFAELFTISPQQGIMQPSDKPFPVQILFKANKEMMIKDNMSLKCQFYEPVTGEVTASTPIRLCARAVFSKFCILPIRELNFGALVFGTKSSRQFVIENMGEFDFRFSIFKIIQGTSDAKGGLNKLRTISRASKTARATSPPTSRAANKREMVKQADATSFGPFTVFPTNGTIAAGSKQQITIEFHSESPGCFEEIVALDISDRFINDFNDVLEYKLVGESCLPGINTTDFVSIFEEQTICKRLELFTTNGNFYAEEDRVFHFGAFLAGQQAHVRFKISNPFKVPSEISLSTRPRSKTKLDATDFAFDVEPKRLTIPSHEHRYISVSFHPNSIQSYAGTFETIVENVAESKNKILSFELRGEGSLPRIVIEKPSLKTKSGISLLKFKKLFIGASQTLPIVVRNEGIINAKYKIEWSSKKTDEFQCKGTNSLHSLQPQASSIIDIHCKPTSIKKIEAELKIKVIDNNFEDLLIKLVGEGYLDDLTFDNLPDGENDEISFEDCHIGEVKQIVFNITNHSSEYIRVVWNENSEFQFSPSTFHIRPQNTRDLTVYFSPKQPIELNKVPLICKATKIKYSYQNFDSDWDDRSKTLRWLANETQNKSQTKKITELVPEPQFEYLASTTEYLISASAFADFCAYECDVNSINFKNTLMFQTRVFKFLIQNSGRIMLRFDFKLYDDKGRIVGSFTEDCPFSILPSSGTIVPGESVTITIKFSPLNVNDYEATIVGHIPNLSKDAKALQIQVSGTSIRPFCHFELEESDYITSERRTPEVGISSGIPTLLESNTRVIEFASCGVKVRNTKRFYIVNPTHIAYDFEFTCVAGNLDRIFKCITPKGTVLPNKKNEIVFEFVPEVVDVKESLWKFSIIGHNIQISFLLTGHALEPNVGLDKSSINFKSLLVGRQMKEIVKLTNNESIPFAFAFNETSFEMNNEGIPVLKFSPISGTVAPHAEIPIELVFNPATEKIFNFNLICNVRKKPTPLSINVKGEGYEIHESALSELSDGSMFELSTVENNLIDFGEVQLMEKRIKRVAVVNSGKFNFDFSWKLFSKASGTLSITPEIGTVNKGERVICEISFLPTNSINLRGVKANLQVVNGRTYSLLLSGVGSKPLLTFSKTSHDFGTQFIYKPGMTPATVTIKVQNEDIKEVSLDIFCIASNCFEVQSNLSTISPDSPKLNIKFKGESSEISITFYPREARIYNEILKVEINSLSTVDINLIGQGAEFKVDLVNSENRMVNFGAVRIGHTVTRSVKIINKSIIQCPFSLGTVASLEVLSMHSVSITPEGEFCLRPKGVLNIDLKFQPQQRITPFMDEISLEAPGISKPLFIISGACQGIEIKLENDTLPFGAVVQKSSTTRRIQLQNTGDIGAKFHWDDSKFEPDFSITPSEGYISPGMDISLEITFHPAELNPDIRYEAIPCQIEGVLPLSLTLTGMCISQPPQNDAIKFSTAVRQSDTKGIQIQNKSSSAWHIRPIIENDFWSGSEIIDIDPGQTKSYDVTFTPLVMAGEGDGGRHEGSVFFPLPDGSGILYKLYGNTDKPLSEGTITREIPCKTQYTEILQVTNWLKRPQRFKVIMDVAKPDSSTILKGHDFIDVPGLLTREYKLNFYSFKEGVTNAKIIFKNESTQEFLFHNVNFKSTPPGVISTLEMTTSVRQTCNREISIVNPLSTPVSFNTSCNHPDISIPHSFTLQPRQFNLYLKAEGSCTIEFLPLHPKEMMTRVSFTSSELGLYQYDLKLLATPAGPERSLHFKVGLGNSHTQSFRFLSFAKSRTEYTCKIDNIDFTAEKSVFASSASTSGVEVCVDVTYEPSKLGDTRTYLQISSITGGDYLCPLYGHCIAPRPQGPIMIKPGATVSVAFKNVFQNQATFNFIVDNPAFSVKASETMGSKKITNMIISYKPTTVGNSQKKSVGKLTITHSGSN